jgi:predicted RecA/RadA family phage recombinase
MAKNFIAGKGVTIPVSAPYNVSSGNMVAIRGLFGVAQHDALSGARVEIECNAGPIFTLSSITTATISVGERLCWNATSLWLDKTTTAQYCVGVAVPLDTLSDVAKAAGAATVRVLMNSVGGAGVL